MLFLGLRTLDLHPPPGITWETEVDVYIFLLMSLSYRSTLFSSVDAERFLSTDTIAVDHPLLIAPLLFHPTMLDEELQLELVRRIKIKTFVGPGDHAELEALEEAFLAEIASL